MSCPTSVFSAELINTPAATITVVGMGEISAKPDMAEINVGVISQADSASRALNKNNQIMEQLFQVLVKQGILNKDIQTQNFNVSPQYRNEPRQLIGYQVANQVTIKIRQLDKLGNVLDNLVSVGANTVNNIRFAVADSEAILDAARRKAMDDARRKAELYAQSAHLKLGNILQVYEQFANPPNPIQPLTALSRTLSAVPIASGELNFRTQVTVVYESRTR